MAVFCVVAAVRRTIPFGSHSRGVDDLGNQQVPFHAIFRAILRSDSPSDWQWNWFSAGGVPFLPEYGTYLGSPLVPLVALFPKDRLDTAVFVLIVLRIGLAAGLMTMLLRHLRPHGPWVVASTLGAAYACSAWTFNDAEYQPMWLDGLAALPAMTLVGLWARERRRPVVGSLVIALFWWSNFYSAFMASLGAAVLLVIIAIGQGDRLIEVLGACVRFLWRGLLGVALTSVLLVPTLYGVLQGRQAPEETLGAAPWGAVAARLLPLTEGVSVSPSLFVGTAVVLFAATVPFHAGLPMPTRLAYSGGLVALILTMQWPPTQFVWSAFDDPNGSAFRAAFVACGLLVVIAWVAVADGVPSGRALVGAVGVLLWLELLTRLGDSAVVDRHPLSSWLAACLVAVTLLVTMSARSKARTWLPVGAAVLAAGMFAEFVSTGAYIEDRREELIHAQPAWASLTPLHGIAAQTQAEGEWPWHRVSGQLGPGTNRAGLSGVPSLDYYSTANPDVVATTMMGLGSPWALFGRAVFQPDDTLAALLGADLLFTYDYTAGTMTSRRQVAMPMVRVVSRGADPASDVPPNPFEARNLLVASPVYEVPEVVMTPALAAGGGRGERMLEARCTPGREVELYAPSFKGTWSVDGASGEMRAPDPFGQPRSAAGVYGVGVVPATGEVRVQLDHDASQAEGQANPSQGIAVGCLDRKALAAQAVASHSGSSAVSALEIDGGRIVADYTHPVSGDMVVATVSQRGWTCEADGHPTAVGERAGIMAVTLDGAQRVECRYLTPGLTTGAIITAASVAVLAALALQACRRHQRRKHARER